MNGETTMTTMPATSARPAAGPPRMTPGRWIALAIGVPIALVLIGWTGFGFIADFGQASFPVNYTIPVHHGVLSLSSNGADLTVRGGGGGSVAQLTGKVQYSLIRPSFSENNGPDGSTVALGCRMQLGNCGLDAALVVPPRVAVQLSSGGGDMSVSGIDANVTLKSYGGDMTVNGGHGRATLSTGGGDLTANDLSGLLSFASYGGDVSSSNLTSSTVTVNSGGGDVSLVFTLVPRNLNIVSSGGDVNVVLPQGSTYDVTTNSYGGNISEPPSMINPSSSDKIVVDSGGGDISLGYAQ
jgi:hypothetical protein